MTKRITLNFIWRVLCRKPCNVWLALPIQDCHQKILYSDLSIKPKKRIRSKLYDYIYFQVLQKKTISGKIDLKIKKINKYKDITSNDFLKDDRLLELREVRPLALKLKTPRNFYKWIIKNIKFPKNLSNYLKDLNYIYSSSCVLKNLEGECSGKSILFVSLCRSVGIPARLVSGYFIKNGRITLRNARFDANALELHQWAEFFDGGYWIPVDCSLAQEENKNYFGKFHEYRVIISKNMNVKLCSNGSISLLQIGDIKPKGLKSLDVYNNIKIYLRFENGRNRSRSCKKTIREYNWRHGQTT